MSTSPGRGFDAAYLHRTNRTGYKAGALEEGVRAAKGEYLLVFDADFVPTPSLLKELIHFFTDEKVGMVQARWGHINREYSLLTRVQSLMLDGHFVVEHIARNRSGRFFNFNGTAGIWRRTAIVDGRLAARHGNRRHGPLVPCAAARMAVRACPGGACASGNPCEMNSFKTQQYRWAKGSAQTARKLLPLVLRANIPVKVKLEAVFHLTNNFAYLFLVVLACLQLPNMLIRRRLNDPELLLLDIPLFAATSISIALFYLTTHRVLYGNPVGGRQTTADDGWRSGLACRSTTRARWSKGSSAEASNLCARRSTASPRRNRAGAARSTARGKCFTRSSSCSSAHTSW